MTTLETLPLDALRLDGGTQPRAEIDAAAVAEYAEALAAGAELPPLRVVNDGTSLWLWDGFHRWHAHKAAGLSEARCEVVAGTRDEAVWLATGANRAHGLRRTNADKRRAVEMALACRPDASDRVIAEHCGVHHDLVGSVRRQLADSASCNAKPAARTGKDGKTRSLPARPEPAAVRAEAADAPEPDDEPGGWPDDGGAESGTAGGPAKLQASEADPAGLPVPPALREAFAVNGRFDELAGLVRRAQRLAHDLAELPGGELYRDNLGHRGRQGSDEVRHYCEHLKNALTKIDHCRPFASACPYCDGAGGGDCRGCAGRHWVNRACWESAPADYRDAAAMARGAGGEP